MQTQRFIILLFFFFKWPLVSQVFVAEYPEKSIPDWTIRNEATKILTWLYKHKKPKQLIKNYAFLLIFVIVKAPEASPWSRTLFTMPYVYIVF